MTKLDEATMRRALWAIVSREASRTRSKTPLWSRVGNLCGVGSTSAKAICRDLGFDPDTGKVLREEGWIVT